MQILKNGLLFISLLSIAALAAACGGGGPAVGGPNGIDPNETAATVNGKPIKMEAVERAIKQQTKGQEGKLSQLELASARLQVLDTLIQREVMFQKAEKEATVPTEEEVTAEINKQKTQSGKSADQLEKEMKEQGYTEAAVREEMKKVLAIQKLVDKISAKIEPPKDSEIEAFYNGNKDAFVKKKGVKLGAIVIDPAKNFEGDTTVDEQSAVLKANEIIKKLQQGVDFSQLAFENSEDQSRYQKGDLGYIAEDDMKQAFPAQTVANLMSPDFPIGKIMTSNSQGKLYILKLQERSDRDEAVTLETPGVRQQVTDSLINARKQLLQASYQSQAMNEAKIENYLAKKVVENPNELSGARPASADTPAANTNTASVNAPVANTNSSAAVPNSNVTTNAASKPTANANAKPAANSNGGK